MQSNENSVRVLAFQLAATLERYEMELRTLADAWLDAALLRRLQDEFRQLRLLGASLPRLAGAWIAVLVSRAHLLQALHTPRSRVARALQDHLVSVEDLRARCLHLLVRRELA